MAHVRRSKQELCDAVYGAVLAAGKPVTRLEVARAIGTTKNPNMVNMLENLVTLGFVFKVAQPDKFGRVAWFYTTSVDVRDGVESACADAA